MNCFIMHINFKQLLAGQWPIESKKYDLAEEEKQNKRKNSFIYILHFFYLELKVNPRWEIHV